MIKQRKIELLTPAKNLECGMAAVDHEPMRFISVLPVLVHVRRPEILWKT